MGRPPMLYTEVVSVRIDKKLHAMLKDIAALESSYTGRLVTAQQLIRNALQYVYSDNERLRECFRRSRRKNKVDSKPPGR